jgi:cell pole-organizing protein PopZ
MNQPAKAQEPSMEEILASIRRIISDDDSANKPLMPPAPKAAAPATPPPPPPSLRPVPAAPPPRPVAVAPAPAPAREIKPAGVAPAFSGTGGRADSALPEEPAGADILDLTEAMAAPEPAPAEAEFRTIDAQPDVFFTEPVPEQEAPPLPPSAAPDPLEEARRQFAQSAAERSLLSSTTSAAVDAAFNSLAQTVLVQNSRTLEDLVREMLRPMLKSWLDDNLPGLVERLVRAEIERVSRGR